MELDSHVVAVELDGCVLTMKLESPVLAVEYWQFTGVSAYIANRKWSWEQLAQYLLNN